MANWTQLPGLGSVLYNDKEEMDAFDRLPPDWREFLRGLTGNYSAYKIRLARAQGIPDKVIRMSLLRADVKIAEHCRAQQQRALKG